MEKTHLGQPKPKNFLLIDDDPLFCNLMSTTARGLGFDLEYYHSVLEMDPLGSPSRYDLSLLDYDLGPINGLDIAHHAPQLLGDHPVILVSAYERSKILTDHLPYKICGYICKKNGAHSIISYAQTFIQKPH